MLLTIAVALLVLSACGPIAGQEAPKPTNRLAKESSPYLLQHAHNPVDWYPWGDAAFERARELNRPVLLSVGYSTCHWCHVMEEESFEDEEIAAYLNEHYVAVKVDREERPDVDAIYMAAVETFSGHGGWPMTVWLTPDRKPYYAATYIPARDGDRGVKNGFLTLLKVLGRTYHERPDDIATNASKFTAEIRAMLTPTPGSKLPGTAVLDKAAEYYVRGYDSEHGGMKGAPKFPSSLPVRFLLREWQRTGESRYRDMAALTLDRMARGGIYDQVGGGFHRYSTDERWLVPHFEKMLYDNALLTVAYLEGFQATGRQEFAQVAREILAYIAREMTSPQGAFYSATDADSVNPEGEREEGWFFTWTPAELRDVLGDADTKLVAERYGVTEGGNFEGRNILHRAPGEDQELEEALGKLYEARAKRPAPLRDEKILTAWNGLMISAHAFAALVLGEPQYARRAERAADFLLTHSRIDGRLRRSYKDGAARHNAYLEDYAFLTAGLLDLYEATGNPRWMEGAIALDSVLAEHYEDTEAGGFFLTSDDHEELLARQKPAYDGAEPSGNSVAILNLLRLNEFTGKDAYRERADAALQSFEGTLSARPAVLSEMLPALDFRHAAPKEIVIVTRGGRAQAEPLLDRLRSTFVPNRILAVVDEKELERHARLIPLLKHKSARKGEATAYVCERGICDLPATDPQVFAKQLQGRGKESPEERAIAYLAGEVASWRPANGCFSCHNNGDGARALYYARDAGYSVPADALEPTTAWLANPVEWDANPGDPVISDKRLARLQFASALAAAAADREAIETAARLVAADQDPGGGWRIEDGLGSPVTYGSSLATAAAIEVLRAGGREEAANDAQRWLSDQPVRNMPEAAAASSAEFIESSPASDGGWGPYPNSPSTAFDTALAVITLSRLPETPERLRLISQGREYLVRTQLPGGGWPETTRPAGAQSYAQHISTTAWALMALVLSER